MQSQRSNIPWRERVFVTPAEAALIVARSECWVRERILEGRLQGAQLAAGAGPIVVTVESLASLIDATAAAGARQFASLRARVRKERKAAPALRLVIDNDA